MSIDRKQQFLADAQSRIERYRPLLERQFEIELGEVHARELQPARFIEEVMARGIVEWRAKVQAKKGTPPGWLAELAMRWQIRLTKFLAYWPVWLRFRWPDFSMRWNRFSRSVEVSFLGWRPADFDNHQPKIDQYVVHELAHAVWDTLAPGDRHRDRSGWRFWSEGFAHYIADIEFRSHYPAEADLFAGWSPLRIRARDAVARLVAEHGREVLDRLPSEWVELQRRGRN